MTAAYPARLMFPLLSALLMLAGSGCGYMLGGVYDPEIRSVYVPIFESEDYRRGYEFELTEAVQKEIQKRSHFRLVKQPQADTRLIGRIVAIRKDQLTQTGNNDSRQLQVQMAVEVSWEDMRSGRILAEETLPVPVEFVPVVSQASFAPEIGQSLATGKQQAFEKMARKIAEMMETPW
jgi:hypothetical protein